MRDVWARANLGTFNNSFTTSVPSHGIALLRIVGQDVPLVTGFLSDQAFTYVANGFGPVSRDRSNGESGASDGATITLNGNHVREGAGRARAVLDRAPAEREVLELHRQRRGR